MALVHIYISQDPHRKYEQFKINSKKQLLEFFDEGIDLDQPMTITMQVHPKAKKEKA